tara:strand:- start:884 stop:2299 length:1416 start_codon:yes stop_codon:yes gene_type:complete
MKLKPSIYFLGLSCLPIALMSLLNIFYCFYFNYLQNINSYLSVLILALLFFFILVKIGRNDKNNITVYEQIFLIFLIYFLISFLIFIPYLFSSYDISFLDAYFESISGLTSTGFTIFTNIKNLDEPLILWRSSSQWVGGFYFLIFLVLIFSNKRINFKMVDLSYMIEKKINFSSNLVSVTYRIFFIYLSLTALIFFIFLISGIRLFDSMNLSMTIISSGGFLPTQSLEDIIRNNFQLFLLCFTFLIPILNFYLFYNIVLARDNIKEHKEDIYLIIFIISFSIIFYFFNDLKILVVFLNILSSISTSGLSIGYVPENFGLYFLILTLFGGSVLSTTSGIKFLRIYILLKAFLLEISKIVKPNVILNTKIMFSEKKINSDNIKISFLIFILFFFSLFILSTILLVDVLDFENSFKLSILTLTNTTSSNIYGIENIQFSNLFTFTKISLIIFMVIAKVELLAILILVRKVFFKS